MMRLAQRVAIRFREGQDSELGLMQVISRLLEY